MFRYIITGNGMKALAVKSDLNFTDFQELIKRQSRKSHPEGQERIWSYGMIDFVDPQVHTLDSFANGGYCGLAMIGCD